MTDPAPDVSIRWLASVDRLETAVGVHEGEEPRPQEHDAALAVFRQLDRRSLLELALWVIGLARGPLLDAGSTGELALQWLKGLQSAELHKLPEGDLQHLVPPAMDDESLDRTEPVRLTAQCINVFCHGVSALDPEERVLDVIAVVNLTCSILAKPLWWRARGRRHLQRGDSSLRTYYTSPQWQACYRGCWTIVCQRLRMMMPPEAQSSAETARADSGG